MPLFNKLPKDSAVNAVLDRYEDAKARAHAELRIQMHDLAVAIDQISFIGSIDGFEAILSEVCDKYEPLYETLVSSGPPARVGDLLVYDAVWFDPALEKAEQLVRAAGKKLPPGAFLAVYSALQDDWHPGYTSPLGANPAGAKPAPPRVKCEMLILTARSYAES